LRILVNGNFEQNQSGETEKTKKSTKKQSMSKLHPQTKTQAKQRNYPPKIKEKGEGLGVGKRRIRQTRIKGK